MYRHIHRLAPTLLWLTLAGCPGTSELVICANDEPCGPGQECVSGKCVSTACASGSCPEGSACILGKCIPICGAGAAASCTKGLTCCSKLCVDLDESVNDCGSCGNSCLPYGDRCERGSCQCGSFSSCVLGKICCKGQCTDADKHGRCPGAGPPDGGVADLPPKLDSKPWSPDSKPWPPDTKAWPDLPPKLDSKPWPPDMPVVKKDAPQPVKDLKPWPDFKAWPDVKPWPDTAPPKPTCGDGKCNGTETCLSCVFDCGTCPCTPGQKQSGKLGCGPCMVRQRTCSSAGQWNAYGGCNYQCSSVQFCVNDTCKPCWPGTSQSKSCSCGTQSRACNQNGTWASWSSCVSKCQGGFSCISGRCGRYYTSYTAGGGPDCGYKQSGYTKYYYYCQLGDYCISTYQKKCRKWQEKKKGDTYHAAKTGNGPDCGYTQSGYTKYYYYCQGGDTCKSTYQKLCTVAGKACNDYYTAYKKGGGPPCGYTQSGYTKYYYYCMPGDWCYSTYQKKCRVVTACGAGSYYHAYAGAGGPQCGYTQVGYTKTYYYCKPMDTCVSTYQKKCRK